MPLPRFTHTFTISCGVHPDILNPDLVSVTIFEAGRFEDTTIESIARAALSSGPDTGLRQWTLLKIRRSKPYNKLEPDYTVDVDFRVKD